MSSYVGVWNGPQTSICINWNGLEDIVELFEKESLGCLARGHIVQLWTSFEHCVTGRLRVLAKTLDEVWPSLWCHRTVCELDKPSWTKWEYAWVLAAGDEGWGMR